jgi:tRNA-splicing ligase RtcB (3'-phosphate/5'-hydroxy nucleic acid ligase)
MHISFADFSQIGPFEWKIDKHAFPNMNVPVILFANEQMIKDCLQDRSIEQAIHAACLPGVVEKVCVMPDMHQGYGFPIGGVAATSIENGVIVPGAIGYDINCGVRLLSSDINYDSIAPYLKEILIEINAACPSGVGKGGRFRLSSSDLEDVCLNGVKWARKNALMEEDEHFAIEDQGTIQPENLRGVSKKAFERGLPQLGSLGAGNHFIEIDLIENIVDEKIARMYGLKEGNITVQIHSGSRGFGHQVCTDFVRLFNENADANKYNLPDRELAYAPLNSNLGRNYLSSMQAAANFAFVNRQLLAFAVRESFHSILDKYVMHSDLITVYDLAHNIGKIETFNMGGKIQDVFIHRKGATRSLGPGNVNLPDMYKHTGQPVLVPGSMGTSSWVLSGSIIAEEKSLNSCCHGAGRVLSRSMARKKIKSDEVLAQMKEKGIVVLSGSQQLLSEEAPQAYKEVGDVVNIIDSIGIAKKVAMLSPIAVVKG